MKSTLFLAAAVASFVHPAHTVEGTVELVSRQSVGDMFQEKSTDLQLRSAVDAEENRPSFGVDSPARTRAFTGTRERHRTILTRCSP
jgi:hypothetical protein